MFRRTPVRWPNNARLALATCVLLETWPEEASATPSFVQESAKGAVPEIRSRKNIAAIAERQYGERVGVYRVLATLKNEGIKASFFVNGRTVEAFPQLMKEIVHEGHELSSETWCHQTVTTMAREEQYTDIRRTVAAFQRHLGFRPQGFLMPGDRPTDDTPRILVELGYKYWMSFLHEDLPYVLRVGKGEIVVVSFGLSLTDHRGVHPESGWNPRELLQVWKDNFDWLYEEGGTYPGFMTLGVHPFLIGRPFRTAMFREFLQYARSRPDVWFARGIDVTNYWLENCRDHLVERWPNYGTGLAYEKTLAK